MLKVFRIFMPYVKKNWWMYALGVVGLILVDGFQLIVPQITRNIIDGLTYGTISDSLLFKYAAYIDWSVGTWTYKPMTRNVVTSPWRRGWGLKQ